MTPKGQLATNATGEDVMVRQLTRRGGTMDRCHKHWKPGITALLAVVAMISTSACNYSVSITPPSATVVSGASQQFTATTSNGSGGDTFQWSLSQSGTTTCTQVVCGTLLATTGATITYVGPTTGSPTSKINLMVSANDSMKDGPATATATITAKIFSVSVSPPSFMFQPGGSSQSFTATVTNSTKGVTWSLSLTGADCTSATLPCGSLSNATPTTVSYTPPAPSVVSTAEQVVLTATPVEDTFITGSAVLSISAGSGTPLAIGVNPATLSVIAGTTSISIFAANLSGTGASQGVTWVLTQAGLACSASACGSLPSSTTTTANYLPPPSTTTTTTVMLTATAVAAPNPTASAMITVMPGQVQTSFLRYIFEVGATTISSYAVVPTTGQLRSLNYIAGPTGQTTTPPPTAAINPNGTALYLLFNPIVSNRQLFILNVGLNGELQQNASSPITLNANYETMAVDPLGQFLYASDESGGTIGVFSLDSSGNPGSSTTAASVSGPVQMVIDSIGMNLFVCTSGGQVAMYSIDRTNGALTLVGAPVMAGTNNPFLVLTPNAQFLFVGSGSSIYEFSVASTGLTSVQGSPFTGLLGTSTDAKQAVVDPGGRYLFVTAQDPDGLFGFSINPSGGIAPLSPASSAVGSSPNLINIDPAGSFAYVANQEDAWVYSLDGSTGALTQVSQIRTRGNAISAQLLSIGTEPLTFTPSALFVANSASNNISQLSIASTGELSNLVLQPVAPGTTPKAVAVLPDMGFAYVANSGSGNLSAFGISSGGALSPLGTPVTTGSGPNWLTADLSGSFLYSANQGASNLWSFSISSSGALASGGAQVNTAGTDPVFVTTEPTGQYLYTANSGAGTINAYSIEFPGGSLTSTNSINSEGTGPDWIAVDPSGRFAYVANLTNGVLGEFTITKGTGALVAGPQPSLQVGSSLSSVVVEPSGKYVFVSDSTLNKIFSYTIDSSAGTLTLNTNGGVSLASGTAPVAMAVDISGQYLYCVNSGTNDISIFTIDLSSGSLSQVGMTTVPTGGTTPAGLTTTGTIN